MQIRLGPLPLFVDDSAAAEAVELEFFRFPVRLVARQEMREDQP
jgi:hypothetical protein